MDQFTQSYIEHALWSSADDDDEPLDQSDAELSPEAIKAMVDDCADFQSANAADLATFEELTGYNGGGDFWLTRCGHGAGYWDRGAGEVGDRLTKAAKAFGTVDLYIGDDNLIYQS